MPAGTPSSHLFVRCPRYPMAWPLRGRTWCPSERGTGSRPAMNREGISIKEKAFLSSMREGIAMQPLLSKQESIAIKKNVMLLS